MNKEQKEFCEKHSITEEQFFGSEEINDGLDLRSLTSIPEGFNPTVGGWLDLNSLTSIPEGFNPTVGGWLGLRSLTSIPEGFNPTVGGWLDLRSLTSIPEGFNPTVGGWLDLRSLTSIPEGFNPTVGGWLDLNSLTSIPEGFNPTVGGSLGLNSLTSIPEGFNPTVGGWLYLRKGSKYIGANIPNDIINWQNGKYISRDGILTEVVSQKANVYRVRKIAQKDIEYLITDGNGNWAHGATLEEAKEDLLYKVTDRKKSDYEHLTLTDTLSHEDAIKCYRVVTGACSSGTRHFVEQKLNGNKKDNYTIAQIISLTRGEYGNESFNNFFNRQSK